MKKKQRNSRIGESGTEACATVRGPSFADKFRALLTDKRKFRMRLIPALLMSFAFAFTFFVFGPYELYISNMKYITFSFRYLVMPMVICGLCVFIVLSFILLMLRGKLFNYALSFVAALTIAGYVQGNFINIKHGTLDGSSVDWTAYTIPAVLNALIWLGILAFVLAVMYFSRKAWTLGIGIVSVMLIGAQTVALISLLTTTNFTIINENGYLSDIGIYELAPKNNVVVFLMDRFDTAYAKKQLEDPEVEKNLSGFTYYEDFTGSYSRTYPSVNYLLTGIKTDYSVPTDEYVKKAWEETTFFKDIKNAGYASKIYTEANYVYFDIDNLRGSVDNIGESTQTVNYKEMVRYMLTLSAYRYAPEALKPYFWFYTGDLASIATVSNSESSIHKTDDVEFYKGVREKGISVDDSLTGEFIFYHLQGSHDPFVMDANGNRVDVSSWDWSAGLKGQTRGNLNMIFEYIRQLKALGLYDSTTIIITADHGWTGTMEKLDHERLLATFVKPAGADPDEPLKRSSKQVCQDNLRASIISYLGLDSTPYGRTLEDIGEDETVTRYFWMSGSNSTKSRRDVNLVTYKINGDGRNFENWKIINKTPIEYPFYDAK